MTLEKTTQHKFTKVATSDSRKETANHCTKRLHLQRLKTIPSQTHNLIIIRAVLYTAQFSKSKYREV